MTIDENMKLIGDALIELYTKAYRAGFTDGMSVNAAPHDHNMLFDKLSENCQEIIDKLYNKKQAKDDK